MALAQKTFTVRRAPVDGKPSYTHIRYSDDGGKSFTAAKPWLDNIISNTAVKTAKGENRINQTISWGIKQSDSGKYILMARISVAENTTTNPQAWFQTGIQGGIGSYSMIGSIITITNGELYVTGEIDLPKMTRTGVIYLRIDNVDGTVAVSDMSMLRADSFSGRNLILGSTTFTGKIYRAYNGVNEGKYQGLVVRKTTGSWNQLGFGVQVKPGKYTFSYFVKGDNVQQGLVVRRLVNGNPDNNIQGLLTTPSHYTVVGSEWVRMSETFECLNDCIAVLSVEKTESGKEMYTAGYKLEVGDTATSYSPAPEDQLFGTTTGRYMGVAVSDKPYPPMLVEDYTWQEVKGRGVTSITKYFALTNSATVKPTGAGSTTAPAMTAENRYLWCREVTEYDDGQIITGEWYLTGVFGKTGNSGTPGTPGADAISIQLDKQAIIVDTDNNGKVGPEQLKEAQVTIEAYKGSRLTYCQGALITSSTGIGATVINSAPRCYVKVTSVGNDPDTSMAYGSGSIRVNISTDGQTFPVVIPVGTNIHKSFAKFKVDNDSAIKNITASVETFKQDAITGAKNYTDGRLQILGNAIISKVSQSKYDQDQREVNKKLANFTIEADHIRASVSSKSGVNLLSDAGFKHGLTQYGYIDRITHPELQYITDAGYNGQKAVGVNCSGLTAGFYTGIFYIVPVREYGDYTFSVYHKTLTATDVQAYIEMHALDADKNRLQSFGLNCYEGTTDWYRTVRTAKIEPVINGKEVKFIEVAFFVVQNGHVLFSCPQLERGDTASAFSLSQQDRLTELGIYDDRIDVKTDKCNFIGLDGLPYIKVLHDDYGIPHLIFYKPDHTIGMDYGWNGIKEMISETTPASWSEPFNLYTSSGFNSNHVISLSNSFNVYKYTASRAVNNGNTVLGSDGDFDEKWYDNNPAINPVNYQFIAYLSDTANLVSGTYYQLGKSFKVTQSGAGVEFTSINVYPLFIVSFQSGKKTSMSSAGHVTRVGNSETEYAMFTDYQAILRTRRF